MLLGLVRGARDRVRSGSAETRRALHRGAARSGPHQESTAGGPTAFFDTLMTRHAVSLPLFQSVRGQHAVVDGKTSDLTFREPSTCPSIHYKDGRASKFMYCNPSRKNPRKRLNENLKIALQRFSTLIDMFDSLRRQRPGRIELHELFSGRLTAWHQRLLDAPRRQRGRFVRLTHDSRRIIVELPSPFTAPDCATASRLRPHPSRQGR